MLPWGCTFYSCIYESSHPGCKFSHILLHLLSLQKEPYITSTNLPWDCTQSVQSVQLACEASVSLRIFSPVTCLLLFPVAEGYPAVQCQFPRRLAHLSPSPTPTSLASSIMAHRRLAHCSAKVLPIAASSARGQLWMKTASALLHLVKFVFICK